MAPGRSLRYRGPCSTAITGPSPAGSATRSSWNSSVGSTCRSLRSTAGDSWPPRSPGTGILSDRLGFSAGGGVWIKDETANVAGSHKGRHLMGLLLHLEVAERLGLGGSSNAARSGHRQLRQRRSGRGGGRPSRGRRLRVFVPSTPTRWSAGCLRCSAPTSSCALVSPGSRRPYLPPSPGGAGGGGAALHLPGKRERPGHRGRGDTRLRDGVGVGGQRAELLDHLVVQVGGGALASACMQAFDEAVQLGVLARGPHIHTAQTAGAHPLERAYRRVAALLPATGAAAGIDAASRTPRHAPLGLHVAVGERAKSIATGHPRRRDLRLAGGRRRHARQRRAPGGGGRGTPRPGLELGQAAGSPVDPTGSAGLAGLLASARPRHRRPGTSGWRCSSPAWSASRASPGASRHRPPELAERPPLVRANEDYDGD